jgi:hypothetical protein
MISSSPYGSVYGDIRKHGDWGYSMVNTYDVSLAYIFVKEANLER